MNRKMSKMIKQTLGAVAFMFALSVSLPAQSNGGQTQRAPSSPARPFVVLAAQPLSELEQRLRSDNKVEELIGGEGMQLRVAVQHDKLREGAAAELHDTSDDVYYVLEGSASLTLGGKLDAPREVEPGEWRSPRIIGGQTFELAKGDLIIVPRGTPHQRATVGKGFSMILIKVFAEPAPPKKPKPTATGNAQKP
jgi:mannose-6-phosphate isomerase-like protein (cupin superfamily)